MDQDFIKKLINISIKRLESSVNAEGLFYNRLIETQGNTKSHGFSLRYSIMALIGLYSAKNSGYEIALNLEEFKSNLLKRMNELPLVDLGNLLQLASVSNDSQMNDQILKFISDNFSNNVLNQQMTVGTAWLLTGFCQSASTFQTYNNSQKIDILKNRLLDSWNAKSHLFCSSSARMKNFIAAKIYCNIGCFADQVYPLIALSEYYQLNPDNKEKEIIRLATEKLIKLQGNLGEWFWIYDVKNGSVLEKYPVYSVHQDSMAPMAFFAAEQVLQQSFADVIEKGLNWFQKMDFGQSQMIDESQNIIWRSLKKSGSNQSFFNHFGLNFGGLNQQTKSRLFAHSYFGKNAQTDDFDSLIIDRETRPYHYGWILKAFCEKSL